MAVNIVIRTLLALFGIGILMLLFMPIIYTLAYDSGLWGEMPVNILAARDNLYGVLLLVPLIGIGCVVLWAYMAATRKDTEEYA